MTTKPTTEVRGDVGDYRACVDPLARNFWVVRKTNAETVLGKLTEHITVNLDGGSPPAVNWSWTLDEAEAERLASSAALLQLRPDRTSKIRYPSWRAALASFAVIHGALERDLAGRTA